ncbi:MAG: ATP-binding protein [Kofleriaceae bacterium]
MKRIALTGGPGAGKTAVLEMIRHALVDQVHVLPEAAGIIFGGGFPRSDQPRVRRAAQRAIYFTQRELEASVDDGHPPIVLCDRGTVDGGAYWIGTDTLWDSVGTTLDAEVARYDVVIHLRVPNHDEYNHQNPLRIETLRAAHVIDSRIAELWARHPHRYEVPAEHEFVAKAAHVLRILRVELPT